ncbi:hypothetical protein N9953_04340 [Akkermansiaceae bacterium]|nr:hypothetical protein [Akkermansiaceae bacterium]
MNSLKEQNDKLQKQMDTLIAAQETKAKEDAALLKTKDAAALVEAEERRLKQKNEMETRALAISKKFTVASDLMDYGLFDKATEEFIRLSNESVDKDTQKKCWLNLGKIAVIQKKIQIAAKYWNQLIAQFPESEEAQEIKSQLSSILKSNQEATVDDVKSAIATQYFEELDFYSEASNLWSIDISYFSRVDMAVYWADRIIKEFPNTPSHELALVEKFKTSMGWEDNNDRRYGALSYGDDDREKYLSQAEKVVNDLEKNFPNSSALGNMYYQLGQFYWRWRRTNDTYNKSAKLWFLKAQKRSGEGGDIYQNVEARLANWNGSGKKFEE